MPHFSREIIIKASPEDVFNYIADPLRHSEWASHELQVTKTSDGDVGVGTTYASVGHQMGTQNDRLTVTDYSPGKRFAFESAGKSGVLSHVFEISAAGEGSRLVKRMGTVRPSLMVRFLTPILMLAGPKGLEKDVAAIKQRLES